MKTPQAKNRISALLLVLLLGSALTGCGGEAYREVVTTEPGGSTGGGGDTGGGTDDSTDGDGDDDDDGSTDVLPTYSYTFSLTGSSGTQPTETFGPIETDNTLRIRVTPGAAGNLSIDDGTYSNFSAQYSCVSFTVTVLGKSVTTKPMAIGGGGYICPGQEGSDTLDFSDRLTSGHDEIEITVSAPKYDYYCNLLYMGYIYQGYYNTYCSSSLYPVYKNHTVTGSLEIEVNGSSLD